MNKRELIRNLVSDLLKKDLLKTWPGVFHGVNIKNYSYGSKD
jgi:hypothetical protein